jgi:pectin methylesterase-like acyl-CoA thioesterase
MKARKPNRGKKEKEKALAANLYARRNEADEWDETPVGASVQPQRAVVTSLRLPVAEFAAVQSAAKAVGQTVSDFIRGAIATKLYGGIHIAALQVAAGAPEGQSQVTVLAPILESGRTQNPDMEILVPLYANLS